MTTLQDKGPNEDGYYGFADMPYFPMKWIDGFGWVGYEVGSDNYIVGRATGEFRPPRKGEYYLSGAIVEVYQARDDLTTSFHIARLVKVEFKDVRVITPVED